MPIHAYFLNANAALIVMGLALSNCCDFQFNVLVFGHQGLNEPNVVDNGDKEWDTIDEHKISR